MQDETSLRPDARPYASDVAAAKEERRALLAELGAVPDAVAGPSVGQLAVSLGRLCRADRAHVFRHPARRVDLARASR